MQTLGGLGWSPWKRPRRHHNGTRYDDNVYDLYAVCNHHGQDLQLGHYTGKVGSGLFYNFHNKISGVSFLHLKVYVIILY